MIRNKKILFITDSCPPNLTMSGIVVKNIIDYLISDNNIDIIAIQQGDDDVTSYRGVPVQYVKSFPYYILVNRKKKRSSGSIAAKWYGCMELFYRLLSIFSRVISPLGINVFITKKIKREVKNKLDSTSYDFVFCNAKPFESFEAVEKLIKKYPSVRYIAYQTDDFASAGDERYIPASIVKKQLKNREKRLNEYIKSFDVYGMLESIYEKEIGYIEKQDVVKKMGIPLLLSNQGTSISEPFSNRKDLLKFVYAGSLVKSFRPPDETLKIIWKLAKERKISVDVYHRGDCDDIVNDFERKSDGCIHNKGTVGAEESYSAINDADILISISNIKGDQISGKTFDYINTGKPIIHFYYASNDRNAEVIERYPCGLNIPVQGMDEGDAADLILSFLDRVDGVAVSRQKTMEEFSNYTVEQVAETLFS